MNQRQLDNIKKIKADLNTINFGESGILVLDDKEINLKEYTFENLPQTGHNVIGVCHKCEEDHCNVLQNDDKKHCLRNMAHGAHTLDFLSAQGRSADVLINEDWSDVPVLFLLENPSNDYDIFHAEGKEVWRGKRPAKKWYWIIGEYGADKDYVYPSQLKQGYYGSMIYSLIRMFKLGNAYATDVVKCGMNSEDGNGYLDTTYYQQKCIENCIQHLKGEINALTQYDENLIVFAFGQRTYELFLSAVSTLGIPNVIPCLMPHPANRLANDYRKYVLFGKAYKTLCNYNINCDAALEEFLREDTGEKNQNPLIHISKEDLDKGFNKIIEECKKEEIKISVETWQPNSHHYKRETLKYWLTEETMLTSGEKLYSEIGFYLQLSDDKKSRISFGFNVNDGFWIWDPCHSTFVDYDVLLEYGDQRSHVYHKCYDMIKNFIH